MESADLKTPSGDPQLEAWLRASSSLPPLPDDGFSRGVLAALPPPPPRISRRAWVCAAGALMGSAVALIGAMTAPAGWPAFTLAELDPVQQLTVPAALGIAALSLWFALRGRPQQLLRR
jgi:hypothetical protein